MKWSAQWARTRRFVLERDGYICQLRGPNCLHHASQVDHIRTRKDAPHLMFDPANLRASCQPCQRTNMPNERVADVGRRPGW